jgi:hypothetical protein
MNAKEFNIISLIPLHQKNHRQKGKREKEEGRKTKTYNSRYSLVVTHPTTNLPI